MADKAAKHAFLVKNLKITHEPDQNRFVIYPADLNSLWPEDAARRTEEKAHLIYKVENNKIDFTSTYCPPPFRGGTGISVFLVENGLNWALGQGYSFVPKHGCWYVQEFMPWPKQPQDDNAKL